MKSKSSLNNLHGFTLVELMVVVLLTGIAVIAIYRGYTAFSHSADVQEQIIEMQQNLRIGMYVLEKDLRRAGINEEDDDTAGFLAAEDETITFTMDLWGDDSLKGEDFDTLDALDGTVDDNIEDLTGDGDDPPNDFGERIRYSLNPDEDINHNGKLDTGEDLNGNNKLDSGRLIREVWSCDAAGNCAFGSSQIIITNVDALNFVYLSEDLRPEDEPDDDPDDLYLDDLDKDITAPFDPTTGRTSLSTSDMSLIRTVEVCLIGRTTNEDYRYTNSESYRNMRDSIPVDAVLADRGKKDIIYVAPGDNYRRRIFCKEIKIRNAGL